jgi:DNA polymerase I-like protein with 3'-5' exonuclease and polymerase domains
MIKIAMVKIDDYLKKEKLMKKAKLILQIHDEVIYEIDQKLLEETVETKHGVKSKFEADIYKIMESILTTEQTKGVPILVESVHGNNWGELK